MDKTIYAESTMMYRPIHNDELSQFTTFQRGLKKKGKRKRMNLYNYRNKLFSSNYRPFILTANGIQTSVEKGSKNEDMFWKVKYSLYSSGNCYYFDTPEEAERSFRISYSTDLKGDWYEKTSQYRIHTNQDNESNVNQTTIIK